MKGEFWYSLQRNWNWQNSE